MSQRGQTRVDCRNRCLRLWNPAESTAHLRREHPGEVWECPEVRSPRRVAAFALPVEAG